MAKKKPVKVAVKKPVIRAPLPAAGPVAVVAPAVPAVSKGPTATLPAGPTLVPPPAPTGGLESFPVVKATPADGGTVNTDLPVEGFGGFATYKPGTGVAMEPDDVPAVEDVPQMSGFVISPVVLVLAVVVVVVLVAMRK